MEETNPNTNNESKIDPSQEGTDSSVSRNIEGGTSESALKELTGKMNEISSALWVLIEKINQNENKNDQARRAGASSPNSLHTYAKTMEDSPSNFSAIAARFPF